MKLFSKILVLAALVGVLFSCKKDGGDKDNSSPKEVVMSYSYTNTPDFFDLMNVSVEYMDDKGSLVKKDITDNWSYTATVPYASAPAEYKFVVTYSSAVSGLEQPKEKYTVQSSFKAKVYKVFPDGSTKNVGFQDITEQAPKNWTAANINEYLRLHEKDMTYSFECSLNE